MLLLVGQGAVLVVEARLSVNLVALTIEQVVSKRRKVVYDMCANMKQELSSEIMASGEWASLTELMAQSGVEDITVAARRALTAKLRKITSHPPGASRHLLSLSNLLAR